MGAKRWPEYSLPDTGKAVRCLINYARENPDKSNGISTRSVPGVLRGVGPYKGVF